MNRSVWGLLYHSKPTLPKKYSLGSFLSPIKPEGGYYSLLNNL